MAKGRTFIVIGAVILAVILLLAWYDGGRKEQRLVVEPVAVSETGK